MNEDVAEDQDAEYKENQIARPHLHSHFKDEPIKLEPLQSRSPFVVIEVARNRRKIGTSSFLAAAEDDTPLFFA